MINRIKILLVLRKKTASILAVAVAGIMISLFFETREVEGA